MAQMMLTKELEKKLPPLYSQDGKGYDAVAVVKYFTPWTNWTWYATEGTRQEDGDMLFFGLVDGHERELGYFSLRELESVTGPFGLRIERDYHFKPTKLSDL
jgi:hypothetical protein